MARRSLGAAASADNQLMTRAEVQALIAAAGGGGGGSALAGNRPAYPGPKVGEYIRQLAISIESQRGPVGALRLGHVHLPGGTFDYVQAPLSNPGTAASLVRFAVYKMSADGVGVGDMAAQTAAISAAATTSSNVIGALFTAPLVVPAGGADFWAGTVNQGVTAEADSPNIARVSRSIENSIFSSMPGIHFAVTGSVMRIDATGALPSTGATATRENDAAPSWLTFRRSA